MRLALASLLLLLPAICSGISFAQTYIPTQSQEVFHFQDFTLMADHVTYDDVTKTAQGTGHAKLVESQKGNTISGYQIIVPNCETKPLGRIFVISRAPQVSK